MGCNPFKPASSTLENQTIDDIGDEMSRKTYRAVDYNKQEVDTAGNKIKEGTQTENDIKIVDDFRVAHAYPMQVFYVALSRRCKKRDPRILVYQRHKKLPSIISKLKRIKSLSLLEMQDLGGCRVIVPKIEQVEEVVKDLKNADVKHILIAENDYIKNPKWKTGYRSHHIIYEYRPSDKKINYKDGLFVEIQIRTNLQHTWATAVESMSVVTGQDLKSGLGDPDLLSFFKHVSSLFAIIEGCVPVPGITKDREDLIRIIRELDKTKRVVTTLSRIKMLKFLDEKKYFNRRKGHYLLVRNYTKNLINIYHYNKVLEANEAYSEYESRKDKDLDAVLVAVKEFSDLKYAYPNYFLDVEEFIKIVKKEIEISEKK